MMGGLNIPTSRCIAYLKDLPKEGQASTKKRHAVFRRSDRFRRGLKSQELLAPKDAVFCDQAWNVYGSQIKFTSEIARGTTVHKVFLNGTYVPQQANVAMRMSWASA